MRDDRRSLPPSRGGTDHEGDSLRRYLSVLRERIWLIVACTVVVVAAAAVYVELASKSYTATAQLQIDAASPSNEVLSNLPVLHESGDPTQDVLSGAQLVTTPAVAAAVVKSLGLDVSPSTALGWVTASPIGQSDFVAVQADTGDPQLSQRVADAFVDETINQTTAGMHSAIAAELPGMRAQLAATPANERYGPGTLGATIQELEQLENQKDPTLVASSGALEPTGPSSPNKKLTLIAGLIGGLVLGIGVAFAAHALDPRLRRTSQLRDLLGVPVLARILKERRGRELPLLPTELSISSQEGYRTLRTVLSVRRGAEPPVYLVTGSGPGEGKSTTAISLAWSLAHTGASVILIEADVRRPTFASAFGLEYFSGVDQVLTDEVSLASALAPVSLDDVEIRVLAASHSGFELSDGLTHDVTQRLLDDAKGLADYVVIDSPPLTVVSDALPFAQLADEVVIVARLDVSRLNRLVDLDDLLRQNGVRASGVVVVGDSHTPGDAYYSGYGSAKRDGVSARRGSVKPRSGLPIDQAE